MQIDVYGSERHKKRRQKERRFVVLGAIVVAYCVFLGVLLILFRSPFLRVQHFVIQENLSVSSDTVQSLLYADVLRDHNPVSAALGITNMLIWPDRLSSGTLRFDPEVKAVSIGKNYFSNTIVASVTEREPLAIWCLGSAMMVQNGTTSTSTDTESAGSAAAGGRCYWFDDEGVAFKNAIDTQGGILFSVHDFSRRPIGIGGTVLPPEFVPDFVSIIETLKQSGLGVRSVSLADLALQEVDVSTYNGPSLYFSLRFPADNDLPVIKKLMGDSGFSKLQYIDCRTENRVYYR